MESIPENYITFNYSDIFFNYYFNTESYCTPMVHEHTLVYVYSGNFLLQEKNKRTIIHEGECVFLKKDNRINMSKQPIFEAGKPFQGIFMNFKRNFLRDFYQKLDKNKLPTEVTKKIASITKLNQSP